MDLLKILGTGLKAMMDEAMTPESFKKGEQFEKYVRSTLFVQSYYELSHKTHSYLENKNDYVETSKLPDYLFRDKKTKRDFYVEVKYRSDFYKDKIEWCKNFEQLKRYQVVNKEKPVFLLLGIGEPASSPQCLCLIPMSDIKYTGLFESFLTKYVIENDKAISSKILWG